MENFNSIDKLFSKNKNLKNSVKQYKIENVKMSIKIISDTGNWTRATWVRARYPNH